VSSEPKVKPDGFLESRHLAGAEHAATPVQSRLIDCVEICGVDVADIVAREAGAAVYWNVSRRRSFGARDDGHCHGAQAGDERVDGQHCDAVAADAAGQVSLPDLTPERVHGCSADISWYHAVWQRRWLSAVEIVVLSRYGELAGSLMHKPQALAHHC